MPREAWSIVTVPSSPSFGVYGQPGLLPRVEPAVERVNILITILKQLERHTGARAFVRSSAVGDDRPVARNLAEVLLQVVSGYADRSWDLHVGIAPRYRVPRVDEGELLAPAHALFNFIDSDSGCLHCLHLPSWCL
jgi:hypothetical protein